MRSTNSTTATSRLCRYCYRHKLYNNINTINGIQSNIRQLYTCITPQHTTDTAATNVKTKRTVNNLNDINNKYTLQYFIAKSQQQLLDNNTDTIQQNDDFSDTPQPINIQQDTHTHTKPTNYYIETYGCQMNTADTEVVCSILNNAGYTRVYDMYESDIMLVNTCAIREKAEDKVKHRLNVFKNVKKHNNKQYNNKNIIVVLGCMV